MGEDNSFFNSISIGNSNGQAYEMTGNNAIAQTANDPKHESTCGAFMTQAPKCLAAHHIDQPHFQKDWQT